MKFRKFIHKHIYPRLASVVTNCLMRTTRKNIINRAIPDYHIEHPDSTVIFCFWHGKIVLPYYLYKGLGVHILISEHRDGEFISRLVECNGYRPVRGSSTRGGMKSLKQLLRIGKQGGIIAITPDGPRGPKRKLKDGAIFLAQMTGAPLCPIGIGFSRCWQLRDWSGLQIPKPFARATIAFGKKFEVPRKLSKEEFEEARLAVEGDLERLNNLAARAAGGEEIDGD